MKFFKEQDKKVHQQIEENASMKNDVVSAIKEVAEEVFKLDHELKDVPEEGTKFILEKNLSKERMDMLKKGLQIPTFKLNLSKSVYDEKYMAYFMKDASTLLKAPHILDSVEDVDLVTNLQWSSVVVEAIMLSISTAGIYFHPWHIGQAIELVVPYVPSLLCYLQTFASAWNAPHASPSAKAQAMINLLKTTIQNHIYLLVLKCLTSYMTPGEFNRFYARVYVAVIHPIEVGNTSVIRIKIAHSIPYDHFFNHKMTNISQLATIKAEFEHKEGGFVLLRCNGIAPFLVGDYGI